MRRGIEKPQFVIFNNKICGIHISADFCAEHEWGIDGIKEKFGIAKAQKGLSVKQFKITKVPKISLIQDGKKTYLFASKYDFNANYVPSDLNFIRDGLAGAWDDSSFGIATDNQDHAKFLIRLKKEIEDCNVVIFLSKLPILPKFSNAGLAILIHSEIPDNL